MPVFLKGKRVVARFKIFKSVFDSWETMSRQAAKFMTELGPGKVIGVSQSQGDQVGVITVWYWSEDWEKPEEPSVW